MKQGTIIDALERFSPLAWQEEYDNSGLQVGLFDGAGMPLGPEAEITGVLVCLDITEAVVDEAAARGCNLVVSHHPLIFRPLKNVSGTTYQQRCVAKALCLGIALYAAHTNLDNASGGVSWEMAARLGLRDVRALVPSSGSGVIGVLPEAVPAEDFARTLAAVFNAPHLRYCLPSAPSSASFPSVSSVGTALSSDRSHSDEADGRPLIRTVALCGGSGGEFIPDAIAAGADCYVTGEIRYHDYFEAEGRMLVALGHYESEQYTIDLLARKLQEIISQESTSPASLDQPSCATSEQLSASLDQTSHSSLFEQLSGVSLGCDIPVLKTTLNTNPLKGL